MRRFLILSLILINFIPTLVSAQLKTTDRDREIADTILNKLKNYKDQSTAELVVLAGEALIGTPYLASTLEGEKEELVINLRGLDCTTFAEYTLAIAQTIKSKTIDFAAFASRLKQIRYRKGKIEGYPSRLHYFSDWIWDNAKKGIVEIDSGKICSEVYPLNVNFMSTHPDSYQQLKGNPELIDRMKQIEASIRSRKMYYIPQEKIHKVEDLLKPGDIVGITTSIPGLDMSHVGILVRKNGRIHLLHASSAAEKVVISEKPLEEYLKSGKHTTGIMLARPL